MRQSEVAAIYRREPADHAWGWRIKAGGRVLPAPSSGASLLVAPDPALARRDLRVLFLPPWKPLAKGPSNNLGASIPWLQRRDGCDVPKHTAAVDCPEVPLRVGRPNAEFGRLRFCGFPAKAHAGLKLLHLFWSKRTQYEITTHCF